MHKMRNSDVQFWMHLMNTILFKIIKNRCSTKRQHNNKFTTEFHNHNALVSKFELCSDKLHMLKMLIQIKKHFKDKYS